MTKSALKDHWGDRNAAEVLLSKLSPAGALFYVKAKDPVTGELVPLRACTDVNAVFEAVFQQCVGRPDDVRTAALLVVEALKFTRRTPFADFKGAALYAVHQALDTSPPVILRSTGANFIVKALPPKARNQLAFRLDDEEKMDPDQVMSHVSPRDHVLSGRARRWQDQGELGGLLV